MESRDPVGYEIDTLGRSVGLRTQRVATNAVMTELIATGKTKPTYFIVEIDEVSGLKDAVYFYSGIDSTLVSGQKNLLRRFTPLTGVTLTNPNTYAPHTILLIVPVGTIAALTIPFLATPVDGQMMTIVSRQIVTALTLSGGTVFGNTTALAVNTPVRYIYSSADSGWQLM